MYPGNEFLGPSPIIPVSGNMPGIVFYDTSPNGRLTSIQCINGVFWIAVNAYFDMGLLQWTQANPAQSSSAWTFDGTSTTWAAYTAPAGSAAPINWGNPVYRMQ